MSLINDALKKAQKLQTQQPTTAALPVAPVSARVGAQPGAAMNFERVLLLVVALVAVIVGATAVSLLLLRKNDRPIIAQAAAPAPLAPAAASVPAQTLPVAAAPAPVKTSANASTPAARAVVPPAPPSAAPRAVESAPARMVAVAPVRPTAPPVSPPPPPAATVSVATVASRAPVVASVEPAPPAVQTAPAAPPPPPPDPVAEKRGRILAFIDNAHISGVRMAGSDSKVLMNEHVYRVNSVVSMELGLRLASVGADALTFVDENGVVYTKTF